MTAREYLDSYKLIQTRINVLTAEIERLRAEAESVSINIDGMPKGQGGANKTARLAVKLAECESVLTEEMSGLWTKRMKLLGELGELKSYKHLRLLHLRYIECKSWEHIAVEMGITWRHCYRLHEAALAEFEKIMKK